MTANTEQTHEFRLPLSAEFVERAQALRDDKPVDVDLLLIFWRQDLGSRNCSCVTTASSRKAEKSRSYSVTRTVKSLSEVKER
jgi:hypothetical protein